MKTLIICTATAAIAMASPVFAAGDLSRADVQEVIIKMATNDDGTMYFEPSDFVFETGQAYKLRMVNLDPIKHEVTFGEAGEKCSPARSRLRMPTAN